MKFVTAFPLTLVLASAAMATPAPKPQNTVINITVYGEDPCPAAQSDEIVVCARRPEGERYRIPKELRTKNQEATETAWGSRAIALDEVSATGRPDSCSVVGSYGQTGCFAEMLSRWRAERQQMRTTP